ncbi:MAG: hypothetical protein C0190_07290 [Thermodesulfobacterium geofontis]|uniref:Uncharacterized protein n=1 Tax=Thermodesulfobacterium geofontis TaxID=1295609 RepID=A0A2N7PLM4_9BACT|nr:MAG: hypothetical protein C0190_07290 [Thermodesulfobacterium geofontis]
MINNLLFKFLTYTLTYHPEEFGLIPDNNGFFKIKEIFQVLIFTKKFKKVKLEILKQLFSYYYKDFFEISRDYNLVKPKNVYYSPPQKIEISQIYKYTTLWTFVKPKLWIKISIDGEWKYHNSLIPLFIDKELAQIWAKIKGCILLETISKLISPDTNIFNFREKIFLLDKINYEALKGPQIDQRFLKKYGSKIEIPLRSSPIISFKEPPKSEIEERKLPFRKITHGKKKEKPWKKYQKEKAKRKTSLE